MFKDEVKAHKAEAFYVSISKDMTVDAKRQLTNDVRICPSLKRPCWLTEHDTFDADHVAWLYNKATIRGVDSFFERTRRRVHMFERAIRSSANVGRAWYVYAAYSPAMVGKFWDIFRVVNNYIDVRKVDGLKSTPATRIGLANAPLMYKDVLYYG